MTTRADFLAELLTWEGMPFHHQGRVRAGVDCLGLVVAVCTATGVSAEDVANYRRMEQGNALASELLRQTMGQIDLAQARPGDLLHYRWPGERTPERTQHVALLLGPDLMMHADGRPHVLRVTKARIDFHPDARLQGVYRMPLED
ncbi:C40 family peptidase [Chitinolyticbacter meiyuanensis]|uniref:C40 family peptidase n=1 Tax=Chitinolyticbacter meiyuanensis TaxID=682798 RepID=UPI0011E597EB|nr:NlpC/P60 family protein [Chitinolyticbacter meiyuanensis]